ncbi:MAG: protoporphyrinogen oxidase [Parachlamydia sp.]|nr:MAG: protoporphyrinogen oxidase [Parachlamydia sp.]
MGSEPHIVVLGTGISGLALGWALKQKYGTAIKLTLLEKAPRVGGWIKTSQQQNFLFEQGPHSCRSSGSGSATLQLIEALRLENEVHLGDPAANQRYLWTQNKLQALPSGIFSFLTSPLTRRMIWPVLREFWQPRGELDEETVEAFFTRRFNLPFTETFIDPMISGIYAGNIQNLSLSACLPHFHALEKQHGSLLKGIFASKKPQPSGSPFQQQVQKTTLFSFNQGMEVLVKRLEAELKEHIWLNFPVETLELQPHEVRINREIIAQTVISTLPAYALAPLIANHSPQLSESLQAIPHASIASINLGWNQNVLTPKGFGYLIPAREKEPILGMIWDSCVFPSQNAHAEQTRLCVMIGGSRFPNFTSYTAADFTKIALETVQRHLNIAIPPEVVLPKIIPHAIPQYTLKHAQRVEAIQTFHPRLKIIGSSFYGISVNDCIAQALQTAAEFSL